MVVPLSNDVGFVPPLDRLGYSCGVLFCRKGLPIEERAGRPLNVVVSRRFHGSVSYWGPTCVSDQHHQSKCYGQLPKNPHYAHWPVVTTFSGFLFCRSWMAFVSFRKVRGLIVFFPFLKFLIAHLATPDSRESTRVTRPCVISKGGNPTAR